MTSSRPPFDLTDDDRRQLAERGISEEELRRQLDCFRRGFPALDLVGPATLEDGIERIGDDQRQDLLERWEAAAAVGRLSKFVPASGAASRMFKVLEARRSDPRPLGGEEIEKGLEGDDPDAAHVARFFTQLDRFAFAPALREALTARGLEPERILTSDDRRPVLDTLLEPEGLGYAEMPKGLIPFHRTAQGSRTAFEEQLDEAVEVVGDGQKHARVHFTVAPDWRARIEEHCRQASEGHELGFSEQSPSTDTVAVDLDDRPLRDEQGRLVFRPGGHGALIGNLDALDADVVLIKNIDNVVPPSRRARVSQFQRLLTGLLLERQERAHGYWKRLHEEDEELVDEAMDFVRTGLHRTPPPLVEAGDVHARRTWLFDVLARPIRVCGMVRNEGEPGGGPYRVRAADGGVSLQIVEAVQIDRDDPEQDAHVRNATHFNPVDLVCGVRGPEGEALDLSRFVDEDTGFISQKSKDGVDLKALERPGLWNGAMAHWNTIFVEVPLETFNPVKTVLDLLRPAHQAEE